MNNATTTQIITLIGVFLSFLVGAAGLWVGIKNSKKTTFINSVTTSRIKYIQDFRNYIAEFCGLFYRYSLLANDSPNLIKERKKIIESADKIKYTIMLFLNPNDKEWDSKIINLIDEISESTDDNPKDKINELIKITQYLLKLEWEGAKMESLKGTLSKKEKNRLYKKHVKLYKSSINDETTG